jgi:hypothetical protein
VPCTKTAALCNPGDVCCVNIVDATSDHCGAPGSCGDIFYEFQCSRDEDCPGAHCCGVDTNGDVIPDSMRCGSCSGLLDEPPCGPGLPGCGIFSCKGFPPFGARPGYSTCQ